MNKYEVLLKDNHTLEMKVKKLEEELQEEREEKIKYKVKYIKANNEIKYLKRLLKENNSKTDDIENLTKKMFQMFNI